MLSSLPSSQPVVPDFRLVRRIGGGGYGDVWLAESVTGRFRAVKMVYRDRFASARPFEREFEGIKRFEGISRRHASQLDVLHCGRNDAGGYFYYVMELADAVSGGDESVDPETYAPLTLKEVLGARGRLAPAECAHLGARVAEALQVLHSEGLAHRDVKPSNIIMVHGQAKLADIGLVTGLADESSYVGTDGYIAPEGPGSALGDVFSLGKVLYEMATGLSRFDFPDLPEGLKQSEDFAAFAELNEIILRACSPEPTGRHGSAGDLRGELLLLESGRSIRQVRRNERWAAISKRVAVGVVLLGALGGGAVWFEQRRAEAASELAANELRQRKAIEEKEFMARQNLYSADMNLAEQAIFSGNFGRAEELLLPYIPRGRETGGQDLRGFEWFHAWGLVRGDTEGTLLGHSQVVSSLHVSRDGARLFSTSFDSTVREWSLGERRELRRWRLPGCYIMTSAFNATESLLAVEGGNRPMTGILNLETGAWTTNVSSASPSVVFTPEGDGIVRGTGVLLFDTAGSVEGLDLGLRRTRSFPNSGGHAWFSPDGKRLVTGSWGDVLLSWDWPSAARAGVFTNAGTVMALAFAGDSRRFVTGSRKGELALWAVGEEKAARRVSTHDGTVIWAVAISPDGRRAASAGSDQTVRVWDLETLREERVYRGHRSEVWAVAWSKDGAQLISGGKDESIRLWDARPPAPRVEAGNLAQGAFFSGDDRYAATRDREDRLAVWNVASGQRAATAEGVLAVGGFAADGQGVHVLTADWRLAEIGLDGKARGEGFALEVGESAPARRVLSADGAWLASGLKNGEVWVHGRSTGGKARLLAGHQQMVVSLAVSPDGNWLASGSLDQTARVWDLRTGQEARVLRGHQMGVSAVAFLEKRNWLATGSWDDTARLWDLGTGACLGVLRGHKAGVQHVAFAPDGRTLAALAGDGGLKFWSLAIQRECGGVALRSGERQGYLNFSGSGQTLGAVDQSGHLHILSGPRDLLLDAGDWPRISHNDATGRK